MSPQRIRKLRNKLGRRGAMLTCLSLVVLLIGWGALSRPQEPVSGAFHTYVPDWVTFATYAGAAVLIGLSAWTKRDNLGWLTLYAIFAIRTASYLFSWICSFVDDGVPGDPTAWYSAVFNIIPLSIALICAGWEEPDEEV